jgi:hypothetical protein
MTVEGKVMKRLAFKDLVEATHCGAEGRESVVRGRDFHANAFISWTRSL